MKSLRSLRIPLVVLVALCLLLLLYYQLIYKESAKTIETTVEESIALLSIRTDDISSVAVMKKSGEGYSIKSVEEPSSKAQWLFEGEGVLSADLTYSQLLLNNYVDSISNISSISKLNSEKISLSEYGLDDPDYIVIINMKAGQEKQLFIGNYSIAGDTLYVKFNDEDSIYLVSSSVRKLCEYTYVDFLETQLFSIQYEEVLSFSYTRKTDSISVILSPDYSHVNTETTYTQWKFVSPLSFSASTKMSGFIESILALPIYKFTSTDINSDSYGLDDPEYSFSISKVDGTVVKIRLSKLIGDNYYGVSNLSPNIFMVSKSSLSGLQIPLIEQISPELFAADISEIKSIEATLPEGTFLMEMDIAKDDHFQSVKSEILINKRNAKVSDSDGIGYYEILYNSISSLQIAELNFEANPQNMKTISLKILKKDGSSIRVDYSIIDNDYYVFINDLYLGFIVRESEIYGEDGTNYSEYGIWDAYELLNDALDGQLNGTYDIPES